MSGNRQPWFVIINIEDVLLMLEMSSHYVSISQTSAITDQFIDRRR
jgi:hypothetical protein